MKIAYFDCFSGVSGDMILGALLDAGFELRVLAKELERLRLPSPFRLKKVKVKRQGLAGTKFLVDFSSGSSKPDLPRSLKDIETLIRKSGLKPKVKDLATRVFRRLAEAEREVHRVKLSEQVHFHEVGALDSIIDIVATAIVIEALGLERIYSSKLVVGRGLIESRSGKLPIPAPATLALLKGVEMEISRIPHELVTPTGAAILVTLCSSFGTVPTMKVSRIGYGAGQRDLVETPNLLRVLIGEATRPFAQDTITVIQTNIDDLAPISYERLFERLFAQGALDVYVVPIQMKKSRPGILLTVLCENCLRTTMASAIFDETTTFGMRYYEADRYKLERKFEEVKTEYGRVRIKVGTQGEDFLVISPEYEDCKRIADKFKLPLHKVYEEAKIAYRESKIAR